MRNFPCGTKDRNLSGRDLNDARTGNLVCVHRRAALPGYPESPATNLLFILRARPKIGVWYIRVFRNAEKAANARRPQALCANHHRQAKDFEATSIPVAEAWIPIASVRPGRIIELATQYRLPAVYSYRFEVVEGGLASYEPDGVDLRRRAATYVDRFSMSEALGLTGAATNQV
jgi:hypothetical protein